MLSKDWNLLPPDLLSLVKQRLGGEFAAFAGFCDSNGVLQESFLPLVETTQSNLGKTDTSFLCSMFSSTIVSGANGFGANMEFENAIKLARWALALEPSHLPALMCLANVHTLQEDSKELAPVQERIEAITKRLLATPKTNLSSFEAGMVEALRQTES